jgi:Leucine-rich repeat (LRR) protein
MEEYAAAFLLGGLTLAALAWLWLLVRAFQQQAWWGIFSFILPPVALLFALRHAQRAITPLVIFSLGSMLAAVPVAYLLVGPTDFQLREQLHGKSGLLTLTTNALESDAAHEWMEIRAFYMQMGGVSLALLAWIWLLVRAFKQHRRWGLSVLFFPPAGVVFAGRHPRRGGVPLGLTLICLLVAAIPALYTLYVPLNLGAREKVVEGEKHLTLTGSEAKEAPDPQKDKDVVVLQMAKPDVTDLTLESLKGMKRLKELDLSGTQVTDVGLEILKDLPALSALRLARTKITDKGFRSALFEKESLMMLDLQHTQVSSETAKAWHDAKPGRRVMH